MIFWEIYTDENRENCLYYPGDSLCAVLDPELKESLNNADEFTFKITKDHPLYSSITPRVTRLYCYQNEDFSNPKVFEVTEVEEYMHLTKVVYAVGELADLFCSIQPQARYQTVTPTYMFQRLIEIHNSQVEARRRFEVGLVTVIDPNDSIYRYTNFENTLDVIRGDLCKSLNGYLRIRHLNGKRYLDLLRLDDFGKRCEQPIEFGVNLLDYSRNISASSIATAIIPLGAKKQDAEGGAIQDVQGLDAYTTIESVNDGKNYVYSEEAVKQYGWIRKVVEWDNVTDPKNLLKKGTEYLKETQFADLELELTAVDLSILGSDVDTINLGDFARALAYPFSLDLELPVQEKISYLQDATKNKIVLSNKKKTGFVEQSQYADTELFDKLPQESSILKAASANATKIINGNGENGNVVIHTTDDGVPYEILIMDKPSIKEAKKIWRWNLGGFAYSSDGGKTYGTAITMDGQILADFVAAGTMYADRIRGGDFVVGGTGTGKDGQIIGYDQYNNEIFKLNKDGGWFKGDISAATLKGGAGDTLQKAIDAANTAIEAANQAIQTANEAITRVDGMASQAQTDAGTALTNAGNAQSTANEAKTNAGNAQSTADKAQDKANEAYNLAVTKLSAEEVDAYIAKMTNIQVAGMTVRSIFQFKNHFCDFYSPTEKNVMFLGYKTN